jgi:hypothetical protein
MSEEMKVQQQDTWAVMQTKAANTNAKESIIKGDPVLCYPCMRVNKEYKLCSSYCNKCNRGFCHHHGNFQRGAGICIYCGMTKNEVVSLVKSFKSVRILDKEDAADLIEKAYSLLKSTPVELRTQAFELLDQGLDAPEIAQKLGLRTQQVAAWRAHRTRKTYSS